MDEKERGGQQGSEGCRVSLLMASPISLLTISNRKRSSTYVHALSNI